MNMLNKFIDVYNSGTHKKYKEYIKVYNLKKTLYSMWKINGRRNIILSDEECLNICKTQYTTSSSGQWREFSWKKTLNILLTWRATYNYSPDIIIKEGIEYNISVCYTPCDLFVLFFSVLQKTYKTI